MERSLSGLAGLTCQTLDDDIHSFIPWIIDANNAYHISLFSSTFVLLYYTF